jgi:hypothetical protein
MGGLCVFATVSCPTLCPCVGYCRSTLEREGSDLSWVTAAEDPVDAAMRTRFLAAAASHAGMCNLSFSGLLGGADIASAAVVHLTAPGTASADAVVLSFATDVEHFVPTDTHFLSHCYEASSFALQPAITTTPRHRSVTAWIPVNFAPLQAAIAVRCPALASMTTQVARSVPLFQSALSQRATIYSAAILRSTAGVGVNCLTKLRQYAPVFGSDTTAVIGAPFDGLGPPLLLELVTSMWRGIIHGAPACLGFESNGLLSDSAEIEKAVRGELEAWFAALHELGSDAAATAVAAARSLASATGGEGPIPPLSDVALSRLLGLRLTPGSVEAVKRGVAPPGLPALFEAFEVPQVFGQAMTVGARALAKHCHRDESASWWLPGPMTGTQAAKNQQGLEAVCRVLRDCHWANVHMLPHDIVTYEARCRQGYGARWTTQPSVVDDATGATQHFPVEFRGFLEPQDPEGHEKGWKH